ncbi:hypothetical protein NOS3756_27510 [Nostoc sp. NIES-3756]|jgi:hypothetical protein|nr:hypothetical protein NOS3756_27510 [Nostoc sp. NIES-3756]BAY38475.1 hypothetical protein NIES2111_28220 [Nostoc sp. NIES-2111]
MFNFQVALKPTAYKFISKAILLDCNGIEINTVLVYTGNIKKQKLLSNTISPANLFPWATKAITQSYCISSHEFCICFSN